MTQQCVVRVRHDNVCGHLSFKCHSRSCSTQWRTYSLSALPYSKISNELSRYFFHKVPETLFTDGRTEERLADVRVNPGGRLNKKDGLTRYGDSHVKDKTVSPTVLSLTWKSPYVDKTVFILRRGPVYPIPPSVERRYNELKPGNTYIYQGIRLSSLNRCYLGPLLLTWFNFNPNMDK